MVLFVNTNAQSPGASFVTAREDNRPIPAPEFVVGDVEEITFYLVDGLGDYDERSGVGVNTLKCAMGRFGESNIAYQASWTAVANGFAGTLNLNTNEAHALLVGLEEIEVIFELEVTDADGNRDTVISARVILRQELITTTPSVPTPTDDFYTENEADLRYWQNRFSITALTGGTATDLDGIVTAASAVQTGVGIGIVISGVVYWYRLINSTAAENSPFYIRPNDYNNPANTRVWQLVNQFGAATSNGYTHTQSTPATTWTVVHNFGFRPAGITVWDSSLQFADCEINHLDNNSFEVKHREARTGIVRCI